MGDNKGKSIDNEELSLDVTEDKEIKSIINFEEVTPKAYKNPSKTTEKVVSNESISCLRNEIITVRYIPRESGMITNPKHIFYGGLANNATRTFTVPILESSGTYFNVLTSNEKNFLEEAMGLEPNALSIYLKNNNYWTNLSVRLTKDDNFLDLSDPDDYIKYKILLANKDFIAPSLSSLQDAPRATYQFVLIAEKEESKQANKGLSATMKAYMLLGELQNNKRMLKLVVEIIDGRPISPKSDLDFIQGKAYNLIQANAKLFVSVAEDPYLATKVIIAESLEYNLIRKRGDYLYLATDNTPLCETDEDPTMAMAAKYIGSPRHQEVKLMLEAKLKSYKDKE